MNRPLRLPFGLRLWRMADLTETMHDGLTREYERGVLHAEFHLGHPICDCRNRETAPLVMEVLRMLGEKYDNEAPHKHKNALTPYHNSEYGDA